MEEEIEAQISDLSITKEETEDETLIFLDSVDDYLISIQTLSSTLRQGWLELASARHSMGASRVNTALLSLKNRSAATKLDLHYPHNIDGSTTKSPQFSLCKWTSTHDNNSYSSMEKENIEEDEQLKENINSLESENQESSLESSKGSETVASPHKTDNNFEKEGAKVLKMFGTLVSPKLRASQLSFETALETLVKIANARSSILEAHDVLVKDTKNIKE